VSFVLINQYSTGLLPVTQVKTQSYERIYKLYCEFAFEGRNGSSFGASEDRKLA
jgi:hypothetical protein